MSARFERRARLSRKADFSSVFKQSARSSDHLFAVLARPNQLNYPRLGLAVSRKASKSAVGRNRIKRIIRESFRQQQNLGGLDVVVVGRAGLADYGNAALFASLQQHWARLIRYEQDSNIHSARLSVVVEPRARP